MAKLAIVCGSPSSEMLAPFDSADHDIWVLGNRLDRYPRADLVFEIHDDNSHIGEGYPQWLVNQNIPLVVGDKFPIDASHITKFPFDEAKELIGSTYLTSSTAYMIAYALLKGYEHIELYGVDMAIDDVEYFWQRPCLEAWVGFAKGRGVNVIIPAQSPVFKSDYIEGSGHGGRPDFSKPPFTQAGFSELASMHQSRIDEAKSKIDELSKQITAHDAAKQVYERLCKVARAVESGQEIKTLTDTVAMK